MKKVLLGIFCLFIFHFSFSVTRTFDGSTSNVWSVATNWSGNVVPLSTDDVLIPAGFTVSVTSASMCQNLTVSGTVVLATSQSLSITGNLLGSGILSQNANSIIYLYGDNLHTGTFNEGLGYFYYTGNGNQRVRNTDYYTIYSRGSGVKSVTGGGFRISNFLYIFNGTTFNPRLTLGTRTLTIAGSAYVNGTLSYDFGYFLGQKVYVGGTLYGNGTIDMFEAGKTSGVAVDVLELDGAVSYTGSLSSLASGKIRYINAGDQNVFPSSDYPILEIAGSGSKTALGAITCSGFNLFSGTFSLGSQSTSSLGNYNFLCLGDYSSDLGSAYNYGTLNAKTTQVEGDYSSLGALSFTGGSLRHILRMGGVNNTINGFALYYLSATPLFEYYRTSAQFIAAWAYDLLLSGSAFSHYKDLQANTSISNSVSIVGSTLRSSTYTLNRVIGGGTFYMNPTSTIRVEGVNNFPKNFTNYVLDAGSSQQYWASSGTQIIHSTPVYANLQCINTSTKQVDGILKVAGDFTQGIQANNFLVLASVAGTNYINGNATFSQKVIFPDNVAITLQVGGNVDADNSNSYFDMSTGLAHKLVFLGSNITPITSITGGTTAVVELASTSPQTFGKAIPSFPTLRISGGSIKTPTGDLSIDNAINFNTGIIDLGNYNILMDNSAVFSASAGFNVNNMVLMTGTGFVQKAFNVGSSVINYYVPFGNLINDFSGFQINTNGVASITANANNFLRVKPLINVAPQVSYPNNVLKKHWIISSQNISAFTATISGAYVANDIQGPTNYYGSINGAWRQNASTSWNTNGSRTVNSVTYPLNAIPNGTLTGGVIGSFNHYILYGQPTTLGICQGQSINLPGVSSASFSGGNQFFIEMCSTSGSFFTTSHVVTLYSVSGTNLSGLFNLLIPNNVPATTYTFRIRGTNPVFYTSISGWVLTVNGTPTNTTSNTQVCANGTSIKNLVGTGGTQWVAVPSTVVGISGNIFTAPSVLGVGTFSSATVYNIVPGGCSSTGVAFTINHKPYSLNDNSSVCVNLVKALTPTGGSPWYLVGGIGTISGDNFQSSTSGQVTVMKISAAGCSSDGVNFNVTPNTVITNQPDDLTIGQGNEAQFDVVANGTAPLTYQWARNGININNAPTVSGANTSVLSISGVPLSMNNSLLRVTVSGACGVPQISNVVTLTVLTISSATFRSSVTNGQWNNPAHWQILSSTGVWVTPYYYPGQYVTGDLVSISGGHLMNYNLSSISTLGTTTVAGVLSITGGSIRFGGQNQISLLIISTGKVDNSGSVATISFGQGVENYGVFSSNIATDVTFQRGINNYAGAQLALTGANIKFAVRNQELKCVSCSSLTLAQVSVVGANVLTVNSTLPITQFGSIQGTNSNSTYFLAPNTTIRYYSPVKPMNIGILKAGQNLVSFEYANGSQTINENGEYFTLNIYSGNKTVSGFLKAQNFNHVSSGVLQFSHLQKTIVSVSGNFGIGGAPSIDMSPGGLDHELYVSGQMNGTLGVPDRFIKGNGTVIYNGSILNQNVAGFNYNNLIIENSSVKSLFGNITVLGLTITGGATLATQQYSITGGAGILQMDAGTTLELGSISSTNNIKMVTMSGGNYQIDPNSTVVFQANGNQFIDAIGGTGYGNVVIKNSGVKVSPNSPTNIRGNVTITSGAIYNLDAETYLFGDIINNGAITKNSSLLFAGEGNNQFIKGNSIIDVQNIGLLKTVSGGNVILNNNISTNNFYFCTSGCSLPSPNTASIELGNYNLSISGNILLFNGSNSFITSGNYSSGAVVLVGSTTGQYLNKVVPFSTPIGYSPVTVIGLTGTFNTSSNIELKPIVTITGNSGRYARPGLYAKSNNITGAVNFKFGMDMVDITASPKSVYYYNPTRTTVTGSFVDEPNNYFGVGGNSTFTNINGTFLAEGEYFEPSIYRTIGSSQWSDLSNWERFNGISWLPATTLPGMAVAGDQVLINSSDIVELDIIPTYDLKNITIAGGSNLLFGSQRSILTISGDLISVGTGAALDMRNSDHKLFIGGNSSQFNGNLNTNNSGSEITYFSTGSVSIFAGFGYENINIIGSGVKTILSDFSCSNLLIASGAKLEAHSTTNQSADIFGTSTIAGIFQIKTIGGGDGWNWQFFNNVHIGNTGSLEISNVGDGIILNFLSSLYNNGNIIDNGGNGVIFNFKGDGEFIVNNNTNFGATHLEINANVFFNTSANAKIVNQTGGITVFANSSLTNKGNLIDNDVLLGNASTATFINEGYLVLGSNNQPFGIGNFNVSTPGNIVVYNAVSGNADAKEAVYYNLSIAGGGKKVFEGNMHILNDLFIESGAKYEQGFLGTYLITVDGLINGLGALDIGIGAKAHELFVGGDFNLVAGGYITNNINKTHYFGSLPQNIYPGNINGDMIVSGGGDKSLVSDIEINYGNNLIMAGAVINLGNYNLNLGNIVAQSPYSNVNMIRGDGTEFGGVVFMYPSSPLNFNNKIIPLGTGSDYSPATINDIGIGMSTPPYSLAIQVVTFTSTFDNYVKRYFRISPSENIQNSKFKFEFVNQDLVGIPTDVRLADIKINTSNVDLGGLFYTTTTTGITISSGGFEKIQAYNIPNVLYVSTTSGNWNDNTIWKKSVDNGNTFTSLALGSYPGSITLENYDIIIQNGHTINLFNATSLQPNKLMNLSILGTGILDLKDRSGSTAFEVANETVIEGQLKGSTAVATFNMGKGRLTSSGIISGLSNNTFSFIDYLFNDGVVLNPSPTSTIQLTGFPFTILGSGGINTEIIQVINNTNVLNQSNVTVTGSLNQGIGSNVWENGQNSYFLFKGSSSVWNSGLCILNLTASGNTFEYGNSTTNINIAPVNYANLKLTSPNFSIQKFLPAPASVITILENLIVATNTGFTIQANTTVQVNQNIIGSGRINVAGINSVLKFKGDFLFDGSIFGSSFGNGLEINGDSNQILTPIFYETRLNINKPSGNVLLTGNTTIGGLNTNDNLILTNGLLEVGNNKLTLFESSILDGFGLYNFTPTNSLVLTVSSIVAYKSDITGPNLVLQNFYVPHYDGFGVSYIGAGTTNLQVTKLVAGQHAEMMFKNFDQKAPNQLNDLNSINRHWSVAGNNLQNLGTGNIIFKYTDNDAVSAAETTYKPAFWNGSNWSNIGNSTDMNFATNTGFLANLSSNVLGIYTIGPNSAFSPGDVYSTSGISSAWNGNNAWYKQIGGVGLFSLAGTQYPGQTEVGDKVIINHAISANAISPDILPLGGLTLTGGSLTLNSEPLDVGGKTELYTNSSISLAGSAKFTALDHLLLSGSSNFNTVATSLIEFRNGVTFNNSGANTISAKTLFSTNNQTITGTSPSVLFQTNSITVAGISVTQLGNSITIDQSSSLLGTNLNSVWIAGDNSYLNYQPKRRIMGGGSLQASSNNSNVTFNASLLPATEWQEVPALDYSSLEVYGNVGFEGNSSADNFTAGITKITFSGANMNMLVRNSAYLMNDVSIQMGAGQTLDFQGVINGTPSDLVLLPGTSTVRYSSTTVQSVIGTNYHNLELSGGSGKLQYGNLTVNGTLLLDGAVLSTSGNNIQMTANNFAFGASNPFSNNNYIAFDKPTGWLSVGSVTGTDLTGEYPIGSNGKYTPMVVGVLNASGLSDPRLIVRTDISPVALGGAYVSRYFNLSFVGMSNVNNFSPIFYYDASERVGSPASMMVLADGETFSLTGVVDYTNNYYAPNVNTSVKPDGSYLNADLGQGNLFRSKASGVWNNLANWDMSFDGGSTFTNALYLPGYGVGPDNVSITGGTFISQSSPFSTPLLNLTVTGNVTFNGINVQTNGNTLINTGSELRLNSANYKSEGKSSINSANGFVGSGNLEFNGGLDVNLGYSIFLPITFTGTQTINGTGSLALYGGVTIADNSTVLQKSSIVNFISNPLNGLGSNAIYELGNGNSVGFNFAQMPMQTGQLVANAIGSFVVYPSNLNQILNPTNYYNLEVRGAGHKLLEGVINVANNLRVNAPPATGVISFSGNSLSELNVNGNIDLGSISGINMSGGGFAHILRIGGNVINFPQGGFLSGNGTVLYDGTANQTIFSDNYFNLEVTGGGLKTSSLNGFAVKNNLNLNGAILDLPNDVLDLRPGASITEGQPFSSSNMINCNTSTVLGQCLVRSGTVQSDFDGFVFPIGNDGLYTPVTINLTAAGYNGAIFAKPIPNTTTTSNNYIKRQFLLAVISINGVSDFRPVFTYGEPTERVGNPVDVVLDANYLKTISSGFVNSGNGTFGVNGPGNTTVSGFWTASSQNSQTIIGFNPFAPQYLGNAPIILSNVTATSGLPVTFISSNPAVANVVGNTITILANGVTTITAIQQGNSNYAPAAAVSQILVVVPDKPLGNRGMYFDGVNDYVSTPVPITSNDNITLEAWVKVTSTHAGANLIMYNGNTSLSGYGIFFDETLNVKYLCGSVGVGNSDFYLELNKWTHLTLVRESGIWKLYANGILTTLDNNSIPTSISLPNGFFKVGANNDNLIESMNGQIDEVRIFNSVRSQEQILIDMSSNAPNGAICYWNFDEISGITAGNTGSGGTANDGTLINNPFRSIRVTNNSDNGGAGLGSLRQAIADANSDTDLDYIDFSIQQNSTIVSTINLTAVLPNIINPLYIDGYSAFGSSTNTLSISGGNNAVLKVELNCSVPVSSPLNFQTGAGSKMKGISFHSHTGSPYLFSYVNGFDFSGNYVGLKADGTPDVNTSNGAYIAAGSNVSVTGNVIVKQSNGISLYCNNSFVSGNLVGVSPIGWTKISNGAGIVVFVPGAVNNLIQNNVIGVGNYGLDLRGGGTKIKGNYIGTDPSGTINLGSSSGAGILIQGELNSTIGGINSGEGNLILNNSNYGVWIQSGTGNVLSGNSIALNSNGIVINLGANGNKSAPTITSTNPILISGICANGDIVEVFNDSPQFGSTNQGRTFLGTATTIGTNWSFNGVFTVGERITATATDGVNGTSAFSNAVKVSPFPPSIASFVPTSGAIGSTISISGNYFNPSAANDVYFGAIKTSGIANASGTSITVTVPAGATSVAPIVVRNPVTSLTGSSMETIQGAVVRQFTITNDPILVPIYARTDYTSGTFDIQDISTGDFNGDGLVDMALANFSAGGLPIILATSTSGFGTPNFLSNGGTNPSAIASADFNGDGRLDIAVAQYNSSEVSVHMGNGIGGFGGFVNHLVGNSPISIAVGDFNKDGHLDIVAANYNGNNISILINNQNGGFLSATNISVGGRPISVKVGDFNQDGIADIAVANYQTNNISILINNGIGAFATSSVSLSGGDNPNSITLSDFNNDNILDIAVVNINSTFIRIFSGIGDGTFANLSNIADVVGNSNIKSGDFDGDGNTDLLVSNYSTNDTRIHLNDGIGNFTLNYQVNTNPNMPLGLVVADFNNDGKADFALGNSSLSIFKYNEPAPGLYRSINSGNWNAISNWEVSTNGGLNFEPAGFFPGQFSAQDMVSITGGNNVTLNVNPRPINGLTVSGVLDFSSRNIIVSGYALLHVNGVFNDTDLAGLLIFKEKVLAESNVNLALSNIIFHNGFEINTDNQNLFFGNVTFSGNNQTVSGISNSGVLEFNNTVIIDGDIEVYHSFQSGFGSTNDFWGNINGNSANSTFVVGNLVNFRDAILPMANGILVSSLPGSSVLYGSFGAQNIKSNGQVYNDLYLSAGFETTPKRIAGDLTVNGTFYHWYGNLEYSATVPTKVVVQGAYNNNTSNAIVSMAGGNLAHELVFNNSVFNSANNTSVVSGLNSTVVYNQGFGSQSLLAGSYQNLIINGTNIKQLVEPISAVNLSITGGATLDTKEYQIKGSPTGNMFMESGTSLILGNPNVTTSIGPNFPANYLAANVYLQPSSSITYKSGSGQTLPSGAPYFANLVIDNNDKIVKYDNSSVSTLTVTGILNIKSGTFEIRDYAEPFIVQGNTTIDGVLNFTNIYGGTKNIFRGDITCNNLFLVDNLGNSAGSIDIYGNLIGNNGILSLTGSNAPTINLINTFNGINLINQSNNSNINYYSNSLQQIIVGTYSGIGLYGGGTKTFSENIRVNSVLTLGGAILNIQNKNIVFDNLANIINTPSNVLSSSNMIEIPTIPGAGFLIKEGSTAAQYSNFTYPIGSGGFYSPVTLQSGTFTNPPSFIGIKPIITTLSTIQEYSKRMFVITTPGDEVNFAYNISFQTSPSELVGTPVNVVNIASPTVSLTGASVNTVTGQFNISNLQSFTNNLSGVYASIRPVFEPTVSGISLLIENCNNISQNVTLSGRGTFDVSNEFLVEIANNPFFSNFVVVGKKQAISSVGTEIPLTLNGVSLGNYFVRIRSSSPANLFNLSNTLKVSSLPQLTSSNPSLLLIGRTITLSGTNLATIAQAQISSVTSTIISRSANAVEVVVPNANGNPDFIMVNNTCGNSNQLLTTILGNDFNINISPATALINIDGQRLVLSLNELPAPPKANYRDYTWSFNQNGRIVDVLGGNAFSQTIAGVDNGLVTVTATYLYEPSITATRIVNVTNQQVIFTSTTVGNAFCQGSALTVPFRTTLFSSLATLSAQISDVNGSFANPRDISVFQIPFNTSGFINAQIPTNLAPGNKYRIRVFLDNTVRAIDNGVDITVYPIPVIAPIANQTICAGNFVNIEASANPSSASVSFNPVGASSGVTGMASVSNSTVLSQLINSPNDGFVNYSISAVANGCQSPPTVVNITINQTPVLNTIDDVTICSGESLNIQFSGNNSNIAYQYTASLTSGLTSGFKNGISDTINHSLKGEGQVLYEVLPTLNQCFGSSKTFKVIVNPSPNPDLAVFNSGVKICENSNFAFGFNTQSSFLYQVFKNGNLIGSNLNGTGVRVNTLIPSSNLNLGENVFEIRGSSLNCGFAEFNIKPIVTVVSKPNLNIDFVSDQLAVCRGFDFNLTLKNTESNANYKLFENGVVIDTIRGNNAEISRNINTQSNISNSLRYTVLVNSDECPQNELLNNEAVVAISDVPTIQNITNKQICDTDTLSFNFVTTPQVALSQWTPTSIQSGLLGATTGSGNAMLQIYQGSGFATYSVTPSLGTCRGNSVSFSVVILPSPEKDLSLLIDSVCGSTDGKIIISNAQNNVNYSAIQNFNIVASVTGLNNTAELSINKSILGFGNNFFRIRADANGCKSIFFSDIYNLRVISRDSLPVIEIQKSQGATCDKSTITLVAPNDYLGYQWKYGNAVIVGADQSTYSPVRDGEYAVQVFLANSCKIESEKNTITLTNTLEKPSIISLSAPFDTLLQSSQSVNYQWYVGRQAIVGATERTYKAYYRASYRVKTNIDNDCGLISDAYDVVNPDLELLTRQNFEQTDTTIIIEPKSKNRFEIEIFPSPVEDKLHYIIQTIKKDNFRLVLQNVVGVNVFSKQLAETNFVEGEIDVTEFTCGIYNLLIITEKDVIVKKVLIK